MNLSPSKSKRIEDFFATGQEFEDMFYLALSNTSQDQGKTLDFLNDIKDKWDAYGMSAYFSQAQYDWLERLAG